MTQALYAHMNNKTINLKKINKEKKQILGVLTQCSSTSVSSTIRKEEIRQMSTASVTQD
jgi:hypothetical protein